MTWTPDEASLVHEIAECFDVDLSAQLIGLGLNPASRADKVGRLRRSLLLFSHDCGDENFPLVHRILSDFAYKNEITRTDEFWKLRAIAAIILLTRSLANPKRSQRGRPARTRAEEDADIYEWCVQVDWLKAVLESETGSIVQDRELAEEMAARQHDLHGPSEKWSIDQSDRHIKSADNFKREISEKRSEFESMAERHKFDFRSMRDNSRYLDTGQNASTVLRWAPSRTETDSDECLSTYRKIRALRIEAITSKRKR